MATAADEAKQDEVLYEVSERVATITINRESLQNTISGPMLRMNATVRYCAPR